MQIRMVFWYLDFAAPHMRLVEVGEGDQKKNVDEEWVLKTCDGIEETPLDMWSCDGGDWDGTRVKNVEVLVGEKPTAVLLRHRDVRHCVGLGTELQLVDQLYGNECHARKLETVDLRPKKGMGKLIVVCWGLEAVDPKAFVVPEGEGDGLVLSDFPAIVDHCLGEASHRVVHKVEIWDSSFEYWALNSIMEPIDVGAEHNILLVRHYKNRTPKGMGRFIGMIEEETRRAHMLAESNVGPYQSQEAPPEYLPIPQVNENTGGPREDNKGHKRVAAEEAAPKRGASKLRRKDAGRNGRVDHGEWSVRKDGVAECDLTGDISD
ncbi:hypothetical protein C8Q70DRAFT_935320 [Cubamyces menziesii]|nr:hypothetical protein C8Q70DRAFT_935320 [Cubamyces menziesii]